MLDAVYESGCTSWDTADAYGDSEELIGKWCVRTYITHFRCHAERAKQVQAYWEAQRDFPCDQVWSWFAIRENRRLFAGICEGGSEQIACEARRRSY